MYVRLLNKGNRADCIARDNSYGTPTSLSMNSPPRIDSSKLCDPIAIPDTPPLRGATSVDENIMQSTNSELHVPRSESPELGSTNNRGPTGASGTKFAEPAQLQSNGVQGHLKSPLLTSLHLLENRSDRLGDQPIVSGRQDPQEDNNSPSNPSNLSSAKQVLSPNHSSAPTLGKTYDTFSGLRDIVSQVERNSESADELPKLSSVNPVEFESIAPNMHNLEDSEGGKLNDKTIANPTKNTPMVVDNGEKKYLTPDAQNKTPAPRTTRADSRTAGETSKSSGDKNLGKEKPGRMHPAEGAAQESQIGIESFQKMKLAKMAARLRLAEEQSAGDTELAAFAKRADEIVKTTLSETGANTAELVVEANIVRPTEKQATRETLASGKVAAKASTESNAETKTGMAQIEAAKQMEGKPQVLPTTMRKTRVENKRPSKETEVRDKSNKNNNLPLKPPQNVKHLVASEPVPTLGPEASSELITENKTPENTQLPSEIVDPKTNASTEPKTRKTKNPSGARGRTLDTPPDPMRQTMTPPYPSSLVGKSRLKSTAPSHGLTIQKPLNPDTQPKSAIRQSPTSSRRSVSFAENSTTFSDAQSGTAPSDTKNPKRGVSSAIKSEQATEALARSRGPKNISQQAEAPAPATKDAKKEKTPSNPKIRRDVKLKGRLIEPPVPPKAVTQEEIVISSESEHSISSFYSEDDPETRNARPGSSQRRQRTGGAEASKEKTRIEVEPETVPAKKPTKAEVKVEARQTSAKSAKSAKSVRLPKIDRPEEKLPSTPAVVSREVETHMPKKQRSSTPAQNIDPQILSSSERSSPRAPAQYMSRAVSNSFRSSSDGSGSDSDHNSSPPVETKGRQVEEDKRPDRTVPDARAIIEMVHARTNSLNGSHPSSRPPKATPGGSRSSGSSSNGSSKRMERAVEEQLQRESRQSMNPSPAVKPASQISRRSVANKTPARSSVSTFPSTNSEFPRMTDLMKNQSSVVTSRFGSQRSLPSQPDGSKRALSPFTVPSSSGSESGSDGEEDT